MHLILPPVLKSQVFFDFLAELTAAEHADIITFDLGQLKQIRPGPLATLTSTIIRWLRNQKEVRFHNLDRCPIRGYLQRMNFFQTCGLSMEENFIRHDGKGRFVPLQLVDHPVDDMATDMAECIAPGGGEYQHDMADLYDLAWYVITETANNVRQHSLGLGYVTAQFTGGENMIRLAIADNGKGILRSFQDAGLPWSHNISHEEAIRRALEPRVSSKFGPNNEGVGLTLVSLLTRLTGGWMAVLSGNGIATISKGSEVASTTFTREASHQGTVVALAIDRTQVGKYAKLLTEAKVQAGLLPASFSRANFE